MIIPKIMVVMGVLGLVLVLIVTIGFVFCKNKGEREIMMILSV